MATRRRVMQAFQYQPENFWALDDACPGGRKPDQMAEAADASRSRLAATPSGQT